MVQAPLEQLKARIELLITRQAQLQAENRQLKARLQEQESLARQLQSELAGAGKQLLAKSIAASMPGTDEKRRLRGELDKLIAEIDTLLTSLND